MGMGADSGITYWVTGINPEPWAMGSPFRRGSRGLGISPNGKLKAYQQALAEEFQYQNPHARPQDGELDVTFYFWRSSSHGNQADSTNLLKATEDGLQGILYSNDRVNRSVRGVIMEQGPKISPHIMIVIKAFKRELISIPTPPETPKWANSDWVEPEEDLF